MPKKSRRVNIKKVNYKLNGRFLSWCGQRDYQRSTDNVLKILNNRPSELNLKFCDDQGNTAISLACKQGHLEIIKKLLECKANINDQNIYGNTPLMASFGCLNPAVTQYLLDNGADVNVQDVEGRTALSFACLISHEEPAIQLLDYYIKNKDYDSCFIKDNYNMTFVDHMRCMHSVPTNLIKIVRLLYTKILIREIDDCKTNIHKSFNNKIADFNVLNIISEYLI